MSYYEEVRAAENLIFRDEICGCDCEVVEVDGEILLYAGGYFMGQLWETDSESEYIQQIKEILE